MRRSIRRMSVPTSDTSRSMCVAIPHCVAPTPLSEDDHFVGGLMSLFDAHRDLLFWYAQEQGLTCDGLTPLFG